MSSVRLSRFLSQLVSMSVYASLAGIGLIFLLFSLYILNTLGDREWGIFSK